MKEAFSPLKTKRQWTAALQNLAELAQSNASRERPGVRLSSAAFLYPVPDHVRAQT